jgi:hypothetical protein
MALLGTEVTGVGRITGLHTAVRIDGTQVLFETYARKVKYYDETTSDWIENGSDVLPLAASGEDIAFANYNGLAGAQTWLNSPNGSLFKIMVANPGSITDMYVGGAVNYKGKIKTSPGRMYVWGLLKNKTDPYLSFIDAQKYTQVTNEVLASGNGVLKIFSGTLAFKAAGAKRTCFELSITDGVETFTDDHNGVLTGSAGGSGTINYTTGAWAVTFIAAPANASNNITGTYKWEDSTDDGIADFSYSATRLASEGNVFLQAEGGGDLQTILNYNEIDYCLHKLKIWALNIGQTDTVFTNKIYREKIGIPNWRAATATGDGIYLINDSDEKDPKIQLLTYDLGSDQVIPKNISENLDLSDYRFEKAIGFEWGNYILFACRHKDQTANNTLFAYHKGWKNWRRYGVWVSVVAIYNGMLVAGDSISNNVYILFSGLDDDDSLIDNYRISELSDLQIEGLKKVKKIIIEGNIGIDQTIKISASVDNGSFVEIGTIEGNGSYVDKGQKINVGSMTLGRSEVGGGGSDISAYHYLREIKVGLDKFEKIKLKFEATRLGWASVSEYRFFDLRKKSYKIPKKYRD